MRTSRERRAAEEKRLGEREAALKEEAAAAQLRESALAGRAADVADSASRAAAAAQAARSELDALGGQVSLPDRAPVALPHHKHLPLHGPLKAYLTLRFCQAVCYMFLFYYWHDMDSSLCACMGMPPITMSGTAQLGSVQTPQGRSGI